MPDAGGRTQEGTRMKKEFHEINRYEQGNAQIIKAMKGVAKIVRVEGGYLAFGSIEDYQAWKSQTGACRKGDGHEDQNKGS